jgi:hypothetical protein
MKYSLRPLAENSWILSADGDRIGLVTRTDNKINVIGKLDKKEYENFDELSKKLGSKIQIEEPTPSTSDLETSVINGFPIKHTTYYNVATDPIVSYTRTEKSELRYAAGYYALKFPHGWTRSFCPKLSTIAEYEFIGPYTTKLEMQHQMLSKLKEIKI